MYDPANEHDAYGVGFLPLRGKARRARAALVEKRLNIRLGQCKTRRATIDQSAKRRAMGFAPCRKTEHAAESIKAHLLFPFSSYAPNAMPLKH
jgi:hypothetical protein